MPPPYLTLGPCTPRALSTPPPVVYSSPQRQAEKTPADAALRPVHPGGLTTEISVVADRLTGGRSRRSRRTINGGPVVVGIIGDVPIPGANNGV